MVSRVRVAIKAMSVLPTATVSVVRATCIEALVPTPAGTTDHAARIADSVCPRPAGMIHR